MDAMHFRPVTLLLRSYAQLHPMTGGTVDKLGK